MKKFFRVFVPILLVLAILLCLFWYLFVYDRAFTRDVLLHAARWSDRHDKPAVASWFYDLAYNQSVDSDDVAIELAQQHKASGNFTQAEVILSKALADKSSTDLYIALSKTYVQQDKILDAIKLLDGITDPQILQDMQTLRPAAPTVDHEPGFYNQYIPVTVSCESGTLFVNPNGDYPSIENGAHTEPITLVDGENEIWAVTVADNGLISPLAVFDYTVGGIIEEVVFADAAVEAEVRRILAAPEGSPLMSNQLWDIKAFTMPADAQSYADLKYMPYLQSLVISSGHSDDLSILSVMESLTSLYISDTTVNEETLEIIGSMLYLKELTLSDCGLSTIVPLSNLTLLEYLDLSDNTIRNVQPLENLTGITRLHLQHNVLTDLNSISKLNALTELDISYNALTTLAPICTITGLERLDASHNSLPNILGVDQLVNLRYLALGSNSITSIRALSACTALTELQVSNNALSDIDAVAELPELLTLNFSYNLVTELPQFTAECKLITFDGSHNQLKSVKPLSVVNSLNSVSVDYNEKLATIKPLASCHNLVVVNAYGTKVTEIKELTDRSIVVNYDPTQG